MRERKRVESRREIRRENRGNAEETTGRIAEEYEKVVKQIVEKMKDEKTRRSVEMGELLICELEKSCVASL